jgi:hypothetical protein
MIVTDNIIPDESSWQALPITHRMDWLTDEDTDDLPVRRELAAASVAALGDFWDNEADRAWQDFAPEVG